MTESVTVAELVKANRLDVYSGKDNLERQITTSDISRPGLELTGYFNYYPAKRVQLLGITETSFAKGMSHKKLLDVMRKMCQPETPAFVISTQLDPPEELKESADEAGIPILGPSSQHHVS